MVRAASLMDTILETPRLSVRRLTLADAPFILELVNDASFIRHIGDKNVRSLKDAEGYLRDGPLAMYSQFGFGLMLVRLMQDLTPIGMCGLIKRETLEDVDVGFAYLPAFRGQGYALEATRAMLAFGKRQFGLSRIVAIVSPGNAASIRVLEKAGMKFERMIRLVEDGSNDVQLLAREMD
jgi:[ribosomal protein S5]-alanine N-acetyltransferase